MKKVLIICSVLILFLAVLGVAVWINLASIGTYLGTRLLGKAIGGSVQIGRLEPGYSNGVVSVGIHDLTLKGVAEGTIKDARLELNPWKGFYIKAVEISDFNIVIKDSGGRVDLIPVPVELAELRRGSLTYRGQKYVIRELRVRNFNTGGNLEFELDGGAEGLGNLKTKGGGFFKDKRSDIEGELSFSRVDLSRILTGYEGFLAGSGGFTYKDGKFTFVTDVESSGFAMREDFLKIPIRLAYATAKARVELAGTSTDLKFEQLSFKGVPVILDIRLSGKDFASLELQTGPLSVPDVKEYINLAPLAKRGSDVLDLLTSGTITVKRLTYTEPSPFRAEFYLADVAAAYQKIEVRGVEGTVTLDEQKMLFSAAKGSFRTSSFSDVSVAVPFSPDKYIEARGKFALDMKDVPKLAGLEDFTVTSGVAEGEAEARGREDTAIEVSGTGRLKEARFVWKKLALEASGAYRFHDGQVTLEPLVLSGGKTELVLRGPVQKGLVHLDLKGAVAAGQINSLLHLPYPLDGVAFVEGAFVKEQGSYAARGSLSLRDISVEVPGLIKKEKGVESAATASIRWGQGMARVERLTCTLADATFRASGDMTKDSIVNLEMALSAPQLETVSKLFLGNRLQAAGSLQLNLSVADLRFPLTEIPLIDGVLRLSGGALKLPFLVKPLADIELSADFNGGKSSINLTGLRIGNTVVRKAILSLEAMKSQRFSAMIDMKNFEPADLATPEKKKFRIPIIAKEGLMAKLAGDFDIRSDRVADEELVANDAELTGALVERRIGFSNVSGKVLGGTLSLSGKADLSGALPSLEVSCKAQDIKGGLFLRLFDPDSQILQATGAVMANLSSVGRDSDELLRNMRGEVTVSSRNGVIRKWNLLSKILGILNLYDFLRGKVRLLEKGLPYSKAGLTMKGEDGLFKTEDFLIDSSAMVIVGSGNVNLSDKTMDAKLIVSPMVTLDRAVDKVPIIRSIFKRKEGGFGYVALDVKGPLRDPEVRTSYVDTLAKRPIDLLKNIFLLPKGVFEP
ncbi:MAG TPA: AsmA-like C-terminal domain-containing protein [Syntrophorhabdales bacterium]|nr:AsmA-like C-terminal domain-containing protein [Syntrophorhabdales bacterium]